MPRYGRHKLPPYRFVPGLHPHPTRDPRGHSYAALPALPAHRPWRPEEWPTLQAWLRGVDLFNRFYFWEAHEAWEELWASTPRDELPSVLLQGLIQIAAALLKAHQGFEAGVRTLSASGLHKLQRVAEGAPALMGLDLRQVSLQFEDYFRPLERGEIPRIGVGVPILRLQALARTGHSD